MTNRPELGRLVTDWLVADAPPKAADRVLVGALERVAATSQDRVKPFPRIGRLPWLSRGRGGWVSRNRSMLIPAVALLGALVAAAVGAMVVWRETPPPIESPSAPATAPSTAPDESIAPIGFQGIGTIAFTRYDESGFPRLYLVDPSGADEVQLIDGFGCCGVFAPDGRSLAIGYKTTHEFRGPGSLATGKVVRIDGREMFGLPATCGGCSSIQGIEWLPRAWSADGTRIALEVTGIAGAHDLDGIHVADSGVPGWYWKSQYTTGKGTGDVPIAFSPDGTRLLFMRVTDETPNERIGELFVVGLDDDSIRRVSPREVTVMTGGALTGAAWSPDGRQIAFVGHHTTDPSAAGRLYVVAAEGGEPQIIADAAGTVAWSPDGTWLAIAGAGDGGADVVVVTADGSERRTLTTTFDPRVLGATWSPDGTGLLAFALLPGDDKDGHLVVIPLDGRPIAQVTTAAGRYGEFSWSLLSRDDL